MKFAVHGGTATFEQEMKEADGLSPTVGQTSEREYSGGAHGRELLDAVKPGFRNIQKAGEAVQHLRLAATHER